MRIAEIVSSFINAKNLSSAKIALLGLAFKGFPETDDLRGSPTLKIYNALKRGFGSTIFSFYDPIVKHFSGQSVANSFQECIQDANVVLFLTNHPSLMGIELKSILTRASKPLLIVDCWHNVIDPERAMKEHEVEIFRVGRGRY